MNRQVNQLQEIVWDYYAKYCRDLPWRKPEADGTFDPYKIMVSEIMLQQTQVQRVIPKFQEFITQFPDVASLAKVRLQTVFESWNGLGYYRRAKFLLEAAKQIYQLDSFPDTVEDLIKMPGIGKNTAAAICVYSYNQPQVFIETNIRTVYIHEFFKDKTDVDDMQLLPIIEQTLDKENPREWYWALMDYGSYIKLIHGNVARMSKHYSKQSRFEGSKRQLRAKVLKSLIEQKKSLKQLKQEMKDERIGDVLKDLEKESLITKQNLLYKLG